MALSPLLHPHENDGKRGRIPSGVEEEEPSGRQDRGARAKGRGFQRGRELKAIRKRLV